MHSENMRGGGKKEYARCKSLLRKTGVRMSLKRDELQACTLSRSYRAAADKHGVSGGGGTLPVALERGAELMACAD